MIKNLAAKVLPNAFGASTAVVCHDAGAANIIQAWMLEWPLHAWRPFMTGPAAQSWMHLSSTGANFTDLSMALNDAAVLVSGTGWASDIEHRARKMAKSRGIYNIAVLDHWVNYPDRFVRQGETVLPDEIFVTDGYAKRKAEECFPDVPVCLHENLYLAVQLRELSQLTDDAQDVLYLLEPIRADWPRNAAGEFEALDYFIMHWPKLGIPSDATLRLRAHPSDPPGKYAKWMAEHDDLNVVLDDGPSLALALSQARWVVGCETAAMTIALAAGFTVISSLPPWAPPCRLPHEGIVHLNQLQTSRNNT